MCRYDGIDPGQIGFDIDCVVADTMEAFIRLAAQEYGIAIDPAAITAFQVEECLDIDSTIIGEIFYRLLVEPVRHGLKPIKDAVPVLSELSRHAPLTFITARPQQEPIDNWLRSVLPASAYDRVSLVAMGDHDGKANHIRKMGLRYFVDDRVETCLDLAREGICPLVFTQPWNIGRHSLATIDSWSAIRQMIAVGAYV